MDNIFELHSDLVAKTYKHGSYLAFKINDPKPRDIHKASVRDRLVHHAICRVLYPYFESKFIYDSYSCRVDKGTHRAIERFRKFAWKVSKSNKKTVWVLKGDICKFFASINHQILEEILAKHIKDIDTLWLLSQIIVSFETQGRDGVGLPLGNLTSQLLINIFLNEFDHFVKRDLKAKYYIRYADDFVLLSQNERLLKTILPFIKEFLHKRLKLDLNPEKISIRTLSSGIDFLGWVHFPYYRRLRTSTKWRIYKRITEHPDEETFQSYKGLLKHGNARKIEQKLTKLYLESFGK